MPINVKCKCGQAFSAKEEMAGKAVKCPNCAQPLRIPQPAAAQADDASAPGGLTDLLDEVGLKAKHEDYVGRRCPSCDDPLAQNAVLCVGCGYNLETGKFVDGIRDLGTAGTEDGDEDGMEGIAEMLLERARTTIKEDAKEEKKQRTQGMPLWMLATLLTVCLTFLLVMMFMSRGKALFISGFMWVILMGIVQSVCGIRLIIIAFKEDVKCGLLYMFTFGFYAIYYIFTRWKQCGRFFIISFICGIMSSIGYGLMVWSKEFDDEEQQQQSLRRALNQSVAVIRAPLDPSPPG